MMENNWAGQPGSEQGAAMANDQLRRESIAVVVVTFNSAEVLPGLLQSFDAAMAGTDWQLIVADNASSDDSVSIVRSLAPQATVVEMGGNRGYAAGINAAVAAAAPHTAVLALNPDVRLGSDCVAELVRALREPGVGIAVPCLHDAQAELIESMRREPTILRAFGDAFLGARRAGRHPLIGEVVTDHRLYESERDTDWAEGSTQLVSAECWNRCGPWDERYFLYSEETDFELRAKDAGLRTRFVPTASAIHLEGGSGTNPRLWPLLVTNRVRFYSRRNGALRAVPFWLAVFIRESSRAVMGKKTSQAAVRALLSPRRMREAPGPHSVATPQSRVVRAQ